MDIEGARKYKKKLASQAGVSEHELDLSDKACKKLADYMNEPIIETFRKESSGRN